MTTEQEQASGEFQSPGGFVFGVQGWTWGQPQPRSITFFLDGTAKVSDQHGRPIKGTVVDNKEVRFAQAAPKADDPPGARAKLATHAQVIEALAKERVDWTTLACAGWPQLPYEELVRLPDGVFPPVMGTKQEREAYLDELRKIRDPELRRAAIRLRREMEDTRAKELAATQDD